MQRSRSGLWLSLVLLSWVSSSLQAQQQSVPTTAPQPVVPRLIKFSGSATDTEGKVLSGTVGITFAIYKDQQGGAPVWMETQNLKLDGNGHYTALLGVTKADGLPMDLFTSGEARWVGVQAQGQGQAEQPRVLLLSVPYALKAGDAETVGGLPPSAFVLAAPPASTSMAGATSQGATVQPLVTGTKTVTTAGGTQNLLPKFDATADITNSQISDNGTNVGIGNTAPAAKLDVTGTGIFRGLLSLPATGTATATAGKNSQPFNFTASSFNSGTAAAVNQVFRWQAEAAGNNTTTPSGTLNLLYGSGTAVPTETGLHINNKGVITFASAQTFPATVGTVKSVGLSAPSSDFTVSGSPVTSSGTLALTWKVAPTNSNTANTIVKRDANGAFAAGGITSTSATVGVLGKSSGTNAVADGVDGVTSSFGASGVAGINSSGGVGVYGTGGTGIFGTGFQAGAFGQYGTESVVGQGFRYGGVRGDGGPTGVGVLATVDDGWGLQAYNNSNLRPTIYMENEETANSQSLVLQTYGSGFGGICQISVSGNLLCSGSKSAVVPVDGGTRKVALYAIEGPENWFEDAGGSELVNGAAIVQLEPTFAQTVNTNLDYRVFLTPSGDCKGLYVTRKSSASFEVHELGGGTSNIAFDYRIMAKRRGYENIRLADKTKEFKFPMLARRPAPSAAASVKPALPRPPGVSVSRLTNR